MVSFNSTHKDTFVSVADKKIMFLYITVPKFLLTTIFTDVVSIKFVMQAV